jgi:translation initiation factor IF-1
LERDGNAGDGKIGLIGSGRSTNGKCSTIVPNPMMRGRCSLGKSRTSKLTGRLQRNRHKVVSNK